MFETLLEVVAQSGQPGLPWLWWLAPIGALVALITAFTFYRIVMSFDEGTKEMKEIAAAVRTGAMAYLNSQYRIVAIVFVVLFVIFLVLGFLGLQSLAVPFAFLFGGSLSALAGYFGMRTATNASARTAWAASKSLNQGLQVAFRGGAVMGLVVVGLALVNISVLFLLLYFVVPAVFPALFQTGDRLNEITAILLGGAFGASTMALFARVGGGIYTKAADVGADLVGKVEAGIPEDDPRNPATIADNVGDNVGDVAGMGADLYESYTGAILAAASLGVSAVLTLGGNPILEMQYFTLPMALAGLGAVMAVLGTFLVRTKEDASMHEIIGALNRGINGAAIGVAAGALGLVYLLGIPDPLHTWSVMIIGLLVGIIIGNATERFTSHEFKPTRSIAEQGQTGPATVIIQGLAVGMQSTWVPVVTVGIGTMLSFYLMGGAENALMGLYGVALAAVAMLSPLGITLATDAYGPIADNAGGNAEMAGLDKSVRKNTDELDAVGNTTAATGKGFAIGSAALTALALLAAYIEQVRFSLIAAGQTTVELLGFGNIDVATMTMQQFMTYYEVNLMNPGVMVGMFVGAMTVFIFSAMTMSAVGRAAGAMVEEVRRQFREIAGIMEGTAKPDYARCVEISTASAQREMIAPTILAITIPLVTGLLFGPAGVLGLLAGGLASGFMMAVMMSNAGGAWDNAKKYVETGVMGGKGSDTHKATVVGDTVGDPFKDTSGPSLNILIKLMSMVSLVFAGLIATVGTGGIFAWLVQFIP